MGQFYCVSFVGQRCRPIFMTQEQHKMPESADDNAANLLLFFSNLSANFSVLQRRFHHCSMINKANYFELLFCLQKQTEMTNHSSASHEGWLIFDLEN